MKYKNQILRRKGKKYVQISKTAAKKLFDNGGTILLQSSNMVFDNVYQSPFETNKKSDFFISSISSEEKWFDLICSDYCYYNCDNERGKYINFFKEVQIGCNK